MFKTRAHQTGRVVCHWGGWWSRATGRDLRRLVPPSPPRWRYNWCSHGSRGWLLLVSPILWKTTWSRRPPRMMLTWDCPRPIHYSPEHCNWFKIRIAFRNFIHIHVRAIKILLLTAGTDLAAALNPTAIMNTQPEIVMLQPKPRTSIRCTARILRPWCNILLLFWTEIALIA